MVQYTVTIDVSKAELDQLAEISTIQKNFTQALAQTSATKYDACVVAERVRTVEQIKRIYAVVMGFALTTCITNAYGCARAAEFEWNATFLLTAQVFAFISLISLFLLGAERLLDRKYLQPRSELPTLLHLWFDLATLGIAAIWFVILANSFPAVPSVPEEIGEPMRMKITANLRPFTISLIVLYAIDIVSLLLQLLLIGKRSFFKSIIASRASRNRLLDAHIIWILINAVALAALYEFMPSAESKKLVPYFGWPVNMAALFLILLHGLRFAFDFGLTFKFYYPSEKLVFELKADMEKEKDTTKKAQIEKLLTTASAPAT